jgi:hypothetical protein
MRLLSKALAALFMSVSLSSCAESPDPPPSKEMEALSGHYYLQGVTDVGSELLLRKDGQFRWMLAYGASDQTAQGKWQLKGPQVILKAVQPSSFKTMTFRVESGKLAIDDSEVGFRGTYVRQP